MMGACSGNQHRCLCAVFATLTIALVHWQASIASLAQTSSPVGPRFRLMDQYNRVVDDRQLASKPAVIHFGFTHCPVICPTTVLELAEYMRELGALADDIRFVFVTVDPERDTPDLLRGYLESFDPRIIGLSGEPREIKALASGLGAQFARQPLADGGFTYDHTVFGYLMGPGWKSEGPLFMGTGSSRERVIKRLKGLLARASG